MVLSVFKNGLCPSKTFPLAHSWHDKVFTQREAFLLQALHNGLVKQSHHITVHSSIMQLHTHKLQQLLFNQIPYSCSLSNTLLQEKMGSNVEHFNLD